MKAALVYQVGIANVFRVDRLSTNPTGRNAQRISQSDFHTCEAFVAGLAFAGWEVVSYACNRAGDIATATWTDDLYSAPFSDKFRPVFTEQTCPDCLDVPGKDGLGRICKRCKGKGTIAA